MRAPVHELQVLLAAPARHHKGPTRIIGPAGLAVPTLLILATRKIPQARDGRRVMLSGPYFAASARREAAGARCAAQSARGPKENHWTKAGEAVTALTADIADTEQTMEQDRDGRGAAGKCSVYDF